MSQKSVEQFRVDLQRTASFMRAEIQKELVTQGRRLAAAQKAKVRRRSGTLAESIRVEVGRTEQTSIRNVISGATVSGNVSTQFNELVVSVMAGGPTTTKPVKGGGSYDYAMATELGTQRERPHPFFFNTFRALRPSIEKAIEGAVDRALPSGRRSPF